MEWACLLEPYTHRVCGMHKNMSIAVRDRLRLHRAHNPEANLKAIENAVRDHLHSAFPELTVAILVGGAIGASSYSSIDQKNPTATDVVVLWLSDITDIDSKMMTFVRNDTKALEEVFQHLYKVDLSTKLA